MKNYAPYILPLLLVAGLFALPHAQAQWAAPTEAPPGGNPPLPLNVGPVAQEKEGDLTLVGLGTFLDGIGVVGSSIGITDSELNYRLILNPNNLVPGEGKILTSDKDGNASWEEPSSGSGSFSGGHLFTSSGKAPCSEEEGAVSIGESNGKTLCFVGDK